MGLDLTLLPFRVDFPCAFSLLEVERRSDLFSEVIKLDSTPVPPGFYSHCGRGSTCGEPHYGPTVEDAYGSPLTWVTAYQLRRFAQHEGVTDNPLNRAVWAYLACLPDNEAMALYWH